MEKRHNRGNRLWKSVAAALLCVCVGGLACLTGCGQGASLTGNRSEKGYSLPEIMVIAMTEKKRYEELCTDQIWNVSVNSEGQTFEQYLTERIQIFMEEMKIMNLLAEDRDITLSAEERAAMTQAAESYFSKLTAEDIGYMGVEKEDVQRVFEDYCVAEKLLDELTEGMDLEVSDSEAKVIRFRQIKTDDREKAERFLAAATQDGADFVRCADGEGLTSEERQLGRREETENFEDAAFALADGQLSGIIESEGTYYVLQSIEDYDTEATDARKKRIFEERRRKAFQEIYESYRSGITLTYSGSPWEKLDLDFENAGTEADFFDIYEAYAK